MLPHAQDKHLKNNIKQETSVVMKDHMPKISSFVFQLTAF
jgi:hypothetical protein